MKLVLKPALLVFFLGVILVFIGLAMKPTGQRASEIIMYIGFALFGIFWIWSIINVLGAADLKPFQKRFWMIAVIAVPVLGGLLFNFMHQKPGRIIT